MAKKRTVKKKSEKGIKSVFVFGVLILSAVLICVYMFGGRKTVNVESETVMIGTAEDKISVKGYVIREESVLNAPEAGVVSYRAGEGERVAKGAPVAVVYSGEVSDEVKNELSSIHQRINDIKGSVVEKNLVAGDYIGGATQIKNDIDMITSAVYKGDVSSVVHYKDDIIRLIRKDNQGEAQTTLEKLEARKAELEGSISGNTSVIYSNMAGVMCSQIDGFEDALAIGLLGELTPSYIKNLSGAGKKSSDAVDKGEPCLKLINNYEWYFATVVDEEWVPEMKTGNYVSIRFTDISNEKLGGNIYSISEPEDGKVVVVIKSRSMFAGMYTSRSLEAEIVRKTYKGFKISKNAVHIDDEGKYFVYINSEGAVRKRDVTILYSDDVYVIIKEDNSASNNLLLYDEVIVSDKDVKEGETL